MVVPAKVQAIQARVKCQEHKRSTAQYNTKKNARPVRSETNGNKANAIQNQLVEKKRMESKYQCAQNQQADLSRKTYTKI